MRRQKRLAEPSRARTRVYKAILVGALLVTLHRGDGGEVIVATAHVTSLRAPAGPLGKLAPSSNCLIGLDDGKFIGVLETCAEVRRQIEGAGR